MEKSNAEAALARLLSPLCNTYWTALLQGVCAAVLPVEATLAVALQDSSRMQAALLWTGFKHEAALLMLC